MPVYFIAYESDYGALPDGIEEAIGRFKVRQQVFASSWLGRTNKTGKQVLSELMPHVGDTDEIFFCECVPGHYGFRLSPEKESWLKSR